MNAALESCVGWAFTKAKGSLKYEPATALLVLVAFCHEADLAVHRPSGYTHTAAGDVALMTNLSSSTISRYARDFVRRGLLVDGMLPGFYRVPEQAFGN